MKGHPGTSPFPRYRNANGHWTYPGQSQDYRLRKKERLAGRPRPERCEVCNGLPETRKLHFDHDHETGKFRGWICHRCNTALGLLQDDPLRFEALAEYLRR